MPFKRIESNIALVVGSVVVLTVVLAVFGIVK